MQTILILINHKRIGGPPGLYQSQRKKDLSFMGDLTLNHPSDSVNILWEVMQVVVGMISKLQSVPRCLLDI